MKKENEEKREKMMESYSKLATPLLKARSWGGGMWVRNKKQRDSERSAAARMDC